MGSCMSSNQIHPSSINIIANRYSNKDNLTNRKDINELYKLYCKQNITINKMESYINIMLKECEKMKCFRDKIISQSEENYRRTV